MTTYRCRFIKPEIGDWHEVEWDGEPLLAANAFHERMTSLSGPIGFVVYDDRDGQRGIKVEFALVNVEGYGEVVSRIYHHHIYRRGGVQGRRPALEQVMQAIAAKLGWTHDPMDLLGSWDGEEVDLRP